jgi:hypothetical protein
VVFDADIEMHELPGRRFDGRFIMVADPEAALRRAAPASDGRPPLALS